MDPGPVCSFLRLQHLASIWAPTPRRPPTTTTTSHGRRSPLRFHCAPPLRLHGPAGGNTHCKLSVCVCVCEVNFVPWERPEIFRSDLVTHQDSSLTFSLIPCRQRNENKNSSLNERESEIAVTWTDFSPHVAIHSASDAHSHTPECVSERRPSFDGDMKRRADRLPRKLDSLPPSSVAVQTLSSTPLPRLTLCFLSPFCLSLSTSLCLLFSLSPIASPPIKSIDGHTSRGWQPLLFHPPVCRHTFQSVH